MILRTAIMLSILCSATTPQIIPYRASVDSYGVQGFDRSAPYGAVQSSGDGRYVVFLSDAPNLVADDTNGFQDAFLHDRRTARTERVSVSSDGREADALCGDVRISRDGRFMTFVTLASNLIAGDSNERNDVFLRDREAGTTILVSRSLHGASGNEESYRPRFSPDGRILAFASKASDLTEDDFDDRIDLFAFDLESGVLTRLPHPIPENEVLLGIWDLALSRNGRYVASTWGVHSGYRGSVLQDLATGTVVDPCVDENGVPTIYPASRLSLSDDGTRVLFNVPISIPDVPFQWRVYRAELGTSVCVSVGQDGEKVRYGSTDAKISGDGRHVLLSTHDPLFHEDDDDTFADLYVRNLQSGDLRLISVNPDGAKGDDHSFVGSISRDGRYVAFASQARNLVEGDSNNKLDAFLVDLRAPFDVRISAEQRADELHVEVSAENLGASPVTVSGWIEVRLPSGRPYHANPLRGPRQARLMPGELYLRRYTLPIPSRVPPSEGPFSITAVLADEAGDPLSFAAAGFRIVPR